MSTDGRLLLGRLVLSLCSLSLEGRWESAHDDEFVDIQVKPGKGVPSL